MTNDGESAQKNHKKRKWHRYDARGILTRREREQLRHGFWASDRHIRFSVHVKTWKAINNDLPLILSVMKPDDFWLDFEPYVLPSALEFLKNLADYCYRLEERRLMRERHKKGLKRKIVFREAWRPVGETIREARKEIKTKVS